MGMPLGGVIVTAAAPTRSSAAEAMESATRARQREAARRGEFTCSDVAHVGAEDTDFFEDAGMRCHVVRVAAEVTRPFRAVRRSFRLLASAATRSSRHGRECLDCHCDEARLRGEEAIQLDRHAAQARLLMNSCWSSQAWLRQAW